MGILATDRSYGSLSQGISNSDVSLIVGSGQGTRFPVMAAGEHFWGIIIDGNETIYAKFEFVKVTALTSDTFTIVRGQLGSTAKAFPITTGNIVANIRFVLSHSVQQVKEIAEAYSADTGAVNAYAVKAPITHTAYYAGLTITTKPANTNTAASTINVNSLGAKTIIRPSGNGVRPGDIVASRISHLEYDGTSFVLLNPAKAEFPKKFIEGLVMSNGTDADHDLDFTVGSCRAAGDDGDMVLGTALAGKQADPTTGWAEGAAASGMPIRTKTGTYSTTAAAVSGSGAAFNTEFAVGDILWSVTEAIGRRITVITDADNMTLESAFGTDVPAGEAVKKGGLAPNAKYHTFVLGKTPDPSDVDVGYDTDITADELLAAAAAVDAEWTIYRRIGSFITDGSANILAFNAMEEEGGSLNYTWDTAIQDLSDTTPSISLVSIVLSVPTGIQVEARLAIALSNAAIRNIIITETTHTDVAPVFGNCTISLWDAGDINKVEITRKTNISSQIQYRADGATAGTYTWMTLGWIDVRIT